MKRRLAILAAVLPLALLAVLLIANPPPYWFEENTIRLAWMGSAERAAFNSDSSGNFDEAEFAAAVARCGFRIKRAVPQFLVENPFVLSGTLDGKPRVWECFNATHAIFIVLLVDEKRAESKP